MNNAGRIAVVAVIAVVAFGGAFLLAGGDDEAPSPATDLAVGSSSSTTGTQRSSSGGSGNNPCRVDEVVPTDEAGYEVTVSSEPDPPAPQDTSIEVLVQQDGAPVSGAVVCVSADMPEMNHAGVGGQADDLGEGRYGVEVDFGMRGQWSGGILVIEPGQPAASMPVSFNVQ
jgi:hypothetical protein